MSQPTPDQLAGFTVALTSDRRSDELAASFARRGATVLHAPTLRIVPLDQDAELVDATRAVLGEPAARRRRDDRHRVPRLGRGRRRRRLAPDLLDVLGKARLLARGPKARGAIRAAGLVEAWAATSEVTDEVVDLLLAEGVAGRRVAVQLHGATDPKLLARLTDAGAEVLAVPVYRWGPSPDPAAVQRAVDATCQRTVDAVVFTSAPGSQAFLDAARAAGRGDELVSALRSDVVAAAVGPVTAGPLRDVGLDPLVPDRSRLGALVRAVAVHLTDCRVRRLPTAGGVLELRGQSASLDGRAPDRCRRRRWRCCGRWRRRPGQVVDRPTLLAALPGAADLHAVEMAVARLRTGLGVAGVVETVVKRGYRLAVTSDG
jgi:uroporphyrinogen-III synthase